MQAFLVPDDFRAFMKSVVVYLDAFPPPGGKHLDAEDALKADCGHGGRIDGLEVYRFEYLAQDSSHRWAVVLREAQIREIADGLLIEVPGERFDLHRTHRRAPIGEPLLIWGEYPDDVLTVRTHEELLAAIDLLHAAARELPRMLRVWSAAEDQLVAALFGDQCALYIIESPDGYATSTGNQHRTDSFEVLDHDGNTLTVPWADCVSWDYARRALVQFVEHSNLGDIPVEGRIPSLLLMMGDVDRRAALGARPAPPSELARTSLPRMAGSVPAPIEPADEVTQPVEVELETMHSPGELARWARRLLERLTTGGLLELAPGTRLDELSYQIASLLSAHGFGAERVLDTADWLVNEISMLPRVAKLFATGADLQVALRRSRQP
jgi:hypothetical protein